MKTAALFLLLLLSGACLAAVPALPADAPTPAPPAWCNDYAALLSPGARARIDAKLRDFERQTSTQIVVVLYPALPSPGAVEDFTVRAATAWGVGRKGSDNGAVLFLFAKEHRLRIEVGRGLEGAIPDAIAKRIIEERIVPRLRANDPDGAIGAGVDALIAAAKGEPFAGNGRTVGEENQTKEHKNLGLVFLVVIVLVFFVISRLKVGGGHAGHHYASSGSSPLGWGGPSIGGWGGGGGGGSSSGGDSGFSGGGGDFGGGGAGGSW